MLLDELQARVVKTASTEKLVVHAGPGSGKTLTLIERLKFLTSSGVHAGEVLVISFSVAAKEELEQRIKYTDKNEDIRFIHPRTLDSLATQIITDAGGSCSGSFLSRIKQAQDIIHNSNASIPMAIAGRKHILIDEAQDIVGSRAELLLCILSRLSDVIGFTVFADAAQSIYDFHIDVGAEDEGGMSSLEMIDDLVKLHGAQSVTLEKYYRSNVSEIRDICRIPWKLLLDVEKHTEAFDDLFLRLKSMPSIGAMNPKIRIEELSGKSKALLCRTNYQVIATAASLRKNSPSTKFTISRSERMPKRPYWIAQLLFGLDAQTLLNEASLLERFTKLSDCEESLTDLLLYLKRQLGLKKHDGLYVYHIISALSDEINFRDIRACNSDQLVIGTIHSSKGREYDSVAIYFEYTEDKVRDLLKKDKAKRACTLFVGMSRPRSQLARFLVGSRTADINRLDSMRMINSFTHFGGNRAIETAVRGVSKKLSIVNFQVGLPGDIRTSSFVRKSLELVLHEQIEVLTKVRAGEEVILKLNNVGHYEIYISWYEKPLGSMTPEFSSALKRSLEEVRSTHSENLPHELKGAWVRGLSTASTTPGDTDMIPREILKCGIWGCLELEGWASLDWK